MQYTCIFFWFLLYESKSLQMNISILFYSILFSLYLSFFDVDICDILHFIKEREENAVAAESCDW